MSSKALVWVRDDFRINNNDALIYATNNHDVVTAVFIFNNEIFDNKREAQKWWLSKSLESFSSDLEKLNIGLEIIKDDEVNFFSKLKTSNKISVYWNKVYEPAEFDKDKKIGKDLSEKKINFKFFKGNVLNEYNKITKNDGTPFKVFSPFWRNAEQFYMERLPDKINKVKKCKKIEILFKKQIKSEDILPKSKWYMKFDKYWAPSESKAHECLENFVNKNILN